MIFNRTRDHDDTGEKGTHRRVGLGIPQSLWQGEHWRVCRAGVLVGGEARGLVMETGF